MYGFASFWLSIGLARLFFYFSDFFLEGTYTGDLSIIIQTYDIIHYTFLYFYLYLYIYIFINIISLTMMFIWFSIKSKKEFQAISSVMAIGFTVSLIGWAFETIIVKDLNLISPTIPPILILIGAIIAIAPLIINLEFFYRSLAIWFVVILISFILIFLGLTFFANFPLSIISLIIISISAVALVLLIVYISINIVKRVRTREDTSPVKKEELKDFLTIFTKPQTITEEEINTFREKKICVVCKSKVSRLNYVCPECDVLYCIRCSKALVNLENACWVCDTPINISEQVPVLKVEELLKETELIPNDKEIEND